MCGIYGIWNLNGRPLDLYRLQKSTTSLRHRGPDDEGYFLSNPGNAKLLHCGGEDSDPRLELPYLLDSAHQGWTLGFGFRRLSILDLTPSGHQPMSDPTERYWIVFNGEIYNYLEIRTELAQAGYTFRTATDTEVILAAYQAWGKECLHRFNGMWAFALWDQVEQTLFLARDRFGVKPLYYTWTEEQFAFASEIKALVGSHAQAFEPNDQAIYAYLGRGALPDAQSDSTFFQNINNLPPGHWLEIRPNAFLKQRFWQLSFPASNAPISTASPTALAEKYRELLTDAIRLRLRSDVPVGTCLSGGLDSSSIVCLVNQLVRQGGVPPDQIGQQQKTFSAVYDTEGAYNERQHIEKVLSATGAERNYTVPSGERLLEDANRMVFHQDEPFLSTSIFAQWCVMSKVRERGVIVLLDGQGADEALAGYRPFVHFIGDFLRHAQFAQALRESRALQQNLGIPAGRLLARGASHQLSGHWTDFLRKQNRTLQSNLSVLNRDFTIPQDTSSDWWPWIACHSLSALLHYQIENDGLPFLLRFEDRNSMAFGVEARVPFLDYRLVQFAFNEAAHLRVHDGWTKWILREAMRGILPDEINRRKDKVGFETPEVDLIQNWITSQPDFFNNQAASRDYLDLEAVRREVKLRLESLRDINAIWRWINLEIWLRVWSES